MDTIILASSSPRRKELLTQLIGSNFMAKESAYKENNTLDMKPVDLVSYHSSNKAKDIKNTFNMGIIISADTIVVHKNKVIGKPKNEDDAIKILKNISGNEIEVITGLTVIDVNNNKEINESETTKVKIKELTDEEIKDYVDTGEPLDKAGAFGIQGKGAILVEKIDGCYSNVVGLPLFRLSKILRKLGINIFKI
jgi:septum formation protein